MRDTSISITDKVILGKVRWPKSVTAISNFSHGNFKFQFTYGNFNFTHGDFNFFTVTSILLTAVSMSIRKFSA